MRPSLLDRRGPLNGSYALWVLMIFFFLLPFGFQAARLSLQKRENDVKDWLPSDFSETTELEWFASHFAGESFVLATWPGCTADDQRLKLLEQKIRHESLQVDWAAQEAGHPEWSDEETQDRIRARQLGQEMGLLYPGEGLNDWGGLDEKWLQSADGGWYYLTPDGKLYRWEGSMTGPAGLVRAVQRAIGRFELKGQFITALGPPGDQDTINPFHNDPTLLCAPLFAGVQTGATIVDDLASEGGSLWPIDLTAADRRETVARRRAMERLSGSLFAPAVPHGFDWTVEAFARVVREDPENGIGPEDPLPEDFAQTIGDAMQRFADENTDGDVAQIAEAPTEVQADAWYAVFDALQVDAPERMTAIVVTLTDLAKDHLAFALGRGVLGGPRGRLLQLAEECGLSAAPPPSMAPPPFNRPRPESVGGLPPLRMGGPPVDNVAIDEEGSVTLVRLVGYSVLVGVVLSYLCFASVKVTLMVFVVGGTAAMLSMAFVGWTNGRVDAILMSMPSLVYVLGLSGAIHVINYYRDEVRSGGRTGAAGRALRHAIGPCSLAAATTAIGLASLSTSNLVPISNFGLYSAIGVVATLAILFTYLPAALNVFTPVIGATEPNQSVPNESSSNQSGPKDGGTEVTVGTNPMAAWWAGVGRWITRYHAPVAIVCALVMAVVSVGVFKIKTSVQLLKLFDQDARIIRDYAWIEKEFGKLVPMELVVRMPPSIQKESLLALSITGDGDVSESLDTNDDALASNETVDVTALPLLERIEAVSRIRRVVHKTLGEAGADVVGQAMGVDTFLPPLPGPASSNLSATGMTRRRMQNELAEQYQQLADSDYFRVEEDGPFAGSELWRISLRVGALTDVDYGQFISSLRLATEPVLRAYDTRDALLRGLADAGIKTTAKDRPLVWMVGNEHPATIDDSVLTVRSTDDEQLPGQVRVDTEAIFLSVLGELLAYENVRAGWFDPDQDDRFEDVDSQQWQRTVEKADAVVYLGAESVGLDKLADAKVLVDAQQIRLSQPQPILTDGYPDVSGDGAVQVVYTGVVPVVYKAQRTLLGSLAESIGLAFVLIAAVMMVLLNPGRGIAQRWHPSRLFSGAAAGCVSMIPNMFPVLLVFGAMGHLNQWMPGQFLVDIGTMMTASVAMGVAVDDTIHFLSWFRSYLDEGMSRRDAVIETYRRVGPAMTQTTIVGGLGLFVFALSTFTPTQRFGSLMLILLGAALIGDLVFLPALLVGPLGRCFRPRDPKPVTPDPMPTYDGTDDDSSGSDSDTPTAQPGQPSKADDAMEVTAQDQTVAIIDRDELPRLKLHRPPASEPSDSLPKRR
ncbi:MMPL family protein [Crateriforma conspicua]|uniref:MMPL family protein n=1 Tax=Crateriforma conspicua TaxID=2527996 RepID=A0A5C6FKZ3_9PLAN|nr:MMPL family transporter [Crateriforma conspicua]TWU62677.1 MMPL family protein [Crateriforma conspicua]